MQLLRTPDERFEALPDFSFEPHYVEWNGMRLHHLDEGPKDAPVFLLMHGEPTWSYLYRHWIPELVADGDRCVAPDHPGFGRSDKPTDDEWYVIERHCEALLHRIETLDLRNINLVVQDWGGPIGLRALCDMPERFDRVFIHEHMVAPRRNGVRRRCEGVANHGTEPSSLGWRHAHRSNRGQ
jgi:haloalkane dehalogenase